MFNLIIANLDVKMRPRPAAHPHQQEKKTRKYYIYVMFQFARNIIKNDAKNGSFPSLSFSVERRGWLYTGCCQKQLKDVLLITSDAPLATGITCVYMATFVQAYF